MPESLPDHVQSASATTVVPIHDTVLWGGRRHMCISELHMEIVEGYPPPSTPRRVEPTWLSLTPLDSLPAPRFTFCMQTTHNPLRTSRILTLIQRFSEAPLGNSQELPLFPPHLTGNASSSRVRSAQQVSLTLQHVH